MTMQVVPVLPGLMWEPSVDQAVQVSTIAVGKVALALNPHADDPDQRSVVLVWAHAVASIWLAINDEGRFAHRLYSCGLDKLLWLGVVQGSDWEVGGIAHAKPSQHFVVPLKEGVVEVLATEVVVLRDERPPLKAAAAAAAEW